MQNRVIALGFFDGVHLGHGALMKKAVLRAKELGVRSAVFTFDRLPRGAVTGAQVDLINSSADREKLIRRFYGVDEVMVVPFDDAMRTMPWDRFVEDLLVGELGARHLVVGDDHRFGYKGEGTAEKLKEKCRAMGIGCDVIEQVEVNGERVSSTYIRSMIVTGDMEKANAFLGHPHMLTGTVVHGRGLGHTIGVPTINLSIPEGVVIPAFGVYVTKVKVAGGEYMGVTNVGVRPTVGESTAVTVEPFLLDFSGNLYGAEAEVSFYARVRQEKKFDSLEALRRQIQKDEAVVRSYFAE